MIAGRIYILKSGHPNGSHAIRGEIIEGCSLRVYILPSFFYFSFNALFLFLFLIFTITKCKNAKMNK